MATSARDHLETLTALVPDFPEPGIVFRDLTPVFADGPAFTAVVDELVAPFAGTFDVIAGAEARGFVLAAAAARATGAGLLLVRKAGKLPRASAIREEYSLEYADAALEVHADEFPVGTRVLVMDDVLATGGTLAATTRLVERAGWSVAGISVVLELEGLGGRDLLPGRDVRSIQLV
jgi:adenine phosphoribosyltransferase